MRDTEASYRAYWATLTDRSEREVYVPQALRPKVDGAEALREPLTFEEGEVRTLQAVQESMDRRG